MRIVRILIPSLCALITLAALLCLARQQREIVGTIEECRMLIGRHEAALWEGTERLTGIEADLDALPGQLEASCKRSVAAASVRPDELPAAIERAPASALNDEAGVDPARDLQLLRLLEEGERAYRDGAFDRARDLYAGALEILPDYGPARAGFALAGYRANPLDSGFYATARRLLSGSLPVLRGDRDALEVLAEIALAREEWDEALDLYTELDGRFFAYGEACALAALAAERRFPSSEAASDE